jgi:putative acetyltransferase
MANEILILPINPYSDVAATLIEELVAELSHRYADRDDDEAASFSPADATVPRSAFVVATLNGVPVGCGAIRPMVPDAAEIKRMYVRKTARGVGIGRAILVELERFAAEFGYTRLVLETGVRQPEAIALYESRGFARMPNYVGYHDNPLSVCYGKDVK